MLEVMCAVCGLMGTNVKSLGELFSIKEKSADPRLSIIQNP